jgi:hypothetical protein
MAQPVNRSSSRENISRDDTSVESSRPSGVHGDSGGDAHTGYSTGRSSGMPTISSTSTTSSALVTTGVRRGNSSGELVPRSDSSGVTWSEPAYSPSAQAISQRELALRASAIEIREATTAVQPLAALQKIFSGQDAVRLELPGISGSPFYNNFCTGHWLENLQIRHLDLTIEPNVRKEGRHFEEHRVFLGNVIKVCNALARNGNTGLTLGIDVPLPRLTEDYSATDTYFRTTTQHGFKFIFDALRADMVVVRLGLSGIRSEWFLQDALSDYFAGLAQNSKLEMLDLSHASLSDGDACALARALEQNRSIKLINISGCLTSDDGAEALAKVLAGRKDIQVIT